MVGCDVWYVYIYVVWVYGWCIVCMGGVDIIEVNFFAENLLKGFGKRCSPTIQMWEYHVEVV